MMYEQDFNELGTGSHTSLPEPGGQRGEESNLTRTC